MSYILDALRKADAQRVRDPARGIHAQPALDADGTRLPAANRTGLWATVAIGTVVLAAAAWYLYQDKPSTTVKHVPAAGPVSMTNPAALPALPPPPAPPTPPTSKVTVASLPPAPVSPVAPVPIPAAPAAQMPARPVPTQSLALQAPSPTGPGSLRTEGDPRNTSVPTMRGGPQPGPGMEPASAPPPPLAAPAPANPVPQQPPAAVARPAPVTPAPSTPAPPVTGLPPDAPKLSISGGVYSASASQRMLIVNGQVFSEGAEIGTGVVLEEIKPKSAVLKFRGTRYTVTY
jgi:general secretion pathway protein B